jgi:phage terminase large subunit-like protein
LTFKLIATACLTYEKFNDFKILYCSYGQEFANTFSNDIKLLLQANYNLYQGYSKLNELKLESNNNYLYATGIGGKLTGRGFDLIILDDLYKNFDEYLSKKYNTKLINFYNNVLITRLNNINKGSVFCIMTRWGAGDFSEYLVNEKNFINIRIPALNSKGESNFSPLRTTEHFLKIKNEESSLFTFYAQYQQEPVQNTGNYLEKSELNLIDYSQIPTNPDKSIVVIDTSFENKESSDFFAMIHYYIKDDKIFVYNVIEKRLNAVQQEQFIANYINNNNVDFVFVENKGIGSYLIQKYKFRELNPKKRSKEQRFLDSLNLIKTRLYIPTKYINLVEYLIYFPNIKNDDLIDCITYLNDIEILNKSRPVHTGLNIVDLLRR